MKNVHLNISFNGDCMTTYIEEINMVNESSYQGAGNCISNLTKNINDISNLTKSEQELLDKEDKIIEYLEEIQDKVLEIYKLINN